MKIEYRGKDKETGEWRYGCGVVKGNNETFWMIAPHLLDGDLDVVEIIPETVGQWVGLKDGTTWKDLTEEERTQWTLDGNMPSEWEGKKIFEGDKLKYEGTGLAWELYWDKTHCCYMVLSSAGGRGEFVLPGNVPVVIGTIHDKEAE